MISEEKTIFEAPTRTAFVWTRLLNVPFWVLLNLLPIILYKDLKVSPWLVTLMIVIKPASALLASYWSVFIHERRDRLISNLVWANLLRYFPFLFIPWIHSPSYIIVSFGLYMMLSRGVIPAWMEIFKLNLKSDSRSRVFSYGSALDYFITALFPLVIGLILDDFTFAWRLLFPVAALLGLLSTLFLNKIPSHPIKTELKPVSFDIKEMLLRPWRESLNLLKHRSDFTHFQIGFMLGGAGLMIMQPMIPLFFVDVLKLSYTEMVLAMGVCKAIGYALASPFWIKLFDRLNIYRFSSLVTVIALFFPICLIIAQFNPLLIYLAYLLYGGMQAGSELGWHMSGPLFAQEKESTAYTTTNVLSIGIRGCIAPPFGNFLYLISSSSVALLSGGLFCLLSAYYLNRSSKLSNPIQKTTIT